MKQFDLEQQILDCWKLTDDLDVLNTAILEQSLSTDDASNILLGLIKLYNLKFDRTFKTFEEMIAENRDRLMEAHNKCWEPTGCLGKNSDTVKVSAVQDIPVDLS